MTPKVYLAVDLGAGSGRVMAAGFDGKQIALQELHRFANDPVQAADGWHWDLAGLKTGIQHGIAEGVRIYDEAVQAIGVDTWGVDYGLLDAAGRLLNDPFQYRDARTTGMMEAAFARVPRAEIYAKTGIQFMIFNTLYQLLAERRLNEARQLLLMPDLVAHWLTGHAAVERTNASTTQLLNAATQQWDRDLIARLGLPDHVFGELVDAGTDLGGLTEDLSDATGGCGARVIAVGSHDTASAVVGVPSAEANPVFLSSGTWSLLGRELNAPVITDESLAAGFSNEAGVRGTTRFLKNIAGMWLLQQSKRTWDAAGSKLGFGELVAAAEAAPSFTALLDPDAEAFVAPEDMAGAIAAWLGASGQPALTEPGAVTRSILESLALKYREVTERLVEVTGKPVSRIQVVGGGSQNRLLNQFAADATGCVVEAGPVEATSLGNVVMQLLATGEIGSLAEGRALIRASFPTEVFEPRNREPWDAAYERFRRLS